MSYKTKHNVKWFSFFLFVVIFSFQTQVFPWLGHIEGYLNPAFVNDDVLIINLDGRIYVGGSLESVRLCYLTSVSIINRVGNNNDVIWELSGDPNNLVPYSPGTDLSYGVFEYDTTYIGYELGELFVQTNSRCHSLWATTNTYQIN